MTQQAKDIYSGIKKIFPSSRRSGSFSLGSGRPSSTSELSAEALAAAQEDFGSSRGVSGESSSKKKERRPSFSFSGWKERRSSLSTKKKEPTPPPPSNASSATPAAGGPYAQQHTVTVPTPKADSSYLKTTGFTTTPTALSRSTSHPGHFPGTTSSLHSKPSAAAAVSSTLLRASSSQPSSYQQHPATTARTSSSSSGNGNNQHETGGATGQQAPPVLKSSLKPQTESRSSRSQSIVPELPTKSQLASRTKRLSYNTMSSSSREPVAVEKSSSRSVRTNSYSTANIGPRPVAKEEKKRRFSFSSRHKNQSAPASAVDDVAMIVKPHANTWDSDSDDDYEDTRRPTRGLDRRSVSMDFMEQNPTHLISKIWRKLPIQARLYSGRGSIDLDMQKDRNSFSRSSTAKQQAEKLGQSNYNKPPSPLPNANMFGDKHIYFNQKIVYFPAGEEGGYVALESYDDVLVRVCNFAVHDQRRTATKVQEFLERSMAFLHGTKTKHGNVVSISNEEIRMWRRLARHNWSLEDVTFVQDLPQVEKDKELASRGEKDSRSSSAVTAESDSDSDDRRRRKAAAASAGKQNPEEDNDDEDEDADLALPKGLNLRPLMTVVNSCVNFGEYLFAFEEIDELVRLEYLVEEDGWI
ncbi:hypothetical protein Gpo141_00000963 [Globisporangium polare]